eukprot:TRINITY_DN2033_c0_g1_i1.p1 TRINITY_DN2033_c0_g1~~TRINITY_DN2033_c0_g1_i1.p1  ORF type:complete len:681 (-),score=142.09 TRINITY_DN2033_c0_g1_i1:538-2580(-)
MESNLDKLDTIPDSLETHTNADESIATPIADRTRKRPPSKRKSVDQKNADSDAPDHSDISPELLARLDENTIIIDGVLHPFPQRGRFTLPRLQHRQIMTDKNIIQPVQRFNYIELKPKAVYRTKIYAPPNEKELGIDLVLLERLARCSSKNFINSNQQYLDPRPQFDSRMDDENDPLDFTDVKQFSQPLKMDLFEEVAEMNDKDVANGDVSVDVIPPSTNEQTNEVPSLETAKDVVSDETNKEQTDSKPVESALTTTQGDATANDAPETQEAVPVPAKPTMIKVKAPLEKDEQSGLDFLYITSEEEKNKEVPNGWRELIARARSGFAEQISDKAEETSLVSSNIDSLSSTTVSGTNDDTSVVPTAADSSTQPSSTGESSVPQAPESEITCRYCGLGGKVGVDMFRCIETDCNSYLHVECSTKAFLTIFTLPPNSIAIDGRNESLTTTFKCPCHMCHKSLQPGNSSTLISCIHCTETFLSSFLPSRFKYVSHNSILCKHCLENQESLDNKGSFKDEGKINPKRNPPLPPTVESFPASQAILSSLIFRIQLTANGTSLCRVHLLCREKTTGGPYNVHEHIPGVLDISSTVDSTLLAQISLIDIAVIELRPNSIEELAPFLAIKEQLLAKNRVIFITTKLGYIIVLQPKPFKKIPTTLALYRHNNVIHGKIFRRRGAEIDGPQ